MSFAFDALRRRPDIEGEGLTARLGRHVEPEVKEPESVLTGTVLVGHPVDELLDVVGDRGRRGDRVAGDGDRGFA